jgi:heptosyltransferase II
MNRDLKSVKRIVVRGANWVGDAAMAVPALKALRDFFPEAHITLATPLRAAGIFEDASFLDDLLIVDSGAQTAGRRKISSLWRQAREWRKKEFDLALIFPNSLGTAFVAALANVPVRIGYATQHRSALLTHKVQVPAWHGSKHEVFYYLNLVAEIKKFLTGANVCGETEPPHSDIFISDERREKASEFLHAHGRNAARPLVVFCPGATNSRAKRWPEVNFAALGDSLIESASAQIALIGSPDEKEISNRIAAQMKNAPIITTGLTTLAETIAILSVADLLVTNDTGPAHLAALVGLPALVIFGPTNPVTTRPFSTRAEIIRRPPACAPCMLRECPIDHRCMTAITPAEIAARASQIIGHNVFQVVESFS